MGRYIKNPAISFAFVSGLGRVRDGQVVTGNYDMFVPSVLVHAPAEPVVELPAPNVMDAPDGPQCFCGEPSESEVGLCATHVREGMKELTDALADAVDDDADDEKDEKSEAPKRKRGRPRKNKED